MGGKPSKDMAIVDEDLRLDMIRARVSKKARVREGRNPLICKPLRYKEDVAVVDLLPCFFPCSLLPSLKLCFLAAQDPCK